MRSIARIKRGQYIAALMGLFFALCCVEQAHAQNAFSEMEFDTTSYYVLTLNDGTQLTGKVIKVTETSLIFSTNSIPSIDIPFENIKKIEEIDSLNIRSDGEYWFPNPSSTRYFLSPTAFTLDRKEGYYQNTYLLFNSVNVGLMDFFSVGGGFEFLSTFGSGISPIFYLTPKIGGKVAKDFRLSGGVLMINADDFWLGTIYTVGTYGNTNDNISVGLSWGFIDGEIADRPIYTLGGTKRISRRVSLLTENYFFPDVEGNNSFHLYGFRFFGSKLSTDLGFLNNSDISDDLGIGVPYVGFAVKF
ncbi:MAG: hypothetical protein ED557_13995 [Balneola sp.]|nr:MAG: hypothetical protein ED557_13995 [Balneola sp.]